jgi:predicted nucleotidyltransferase
MKLPEEIKNRIVESLKPLDLEKLVLFGSYANGNPTDESDIDLYVVTKDDFIPANWREKNEIYLKISREIRNIRSDVPIDLIVHTKQMNEKFFELDSSFSKEIIKNGISLI